MDDLAGSKLSEIERGAIAPRTLTSKDEISGADVADALLWPLSKTEAEALDYSKRIYNSGDDWWSRTRDADVVVDSIWYMNSTGSAHMSSLKRTNPLGVRPAFNIKLDSVLFVTNDGSNWSFTLLDSSRSFRAETADIAEENGNKVLTVGYSGAEVGENEQISLIVKNSEGGLTGFYKRLATNIKSADGVLEIDLSQIKLEEGDKISLSSEQANGSMNTNYACAPVEVSMTQPTAGVVISRFTGGISGSNTQTIREKGDASDYKTTLSASSGYSLPEKITVKANGTVLDKSEYSYDPVTGELVIPAEVITYKMEIIAEGRRDYDFRFVDADGGLLLAFDFGTVKAGYGEIARASGFANTGAKTIGIRFDMAKDSPFIVSELSKNVLASDEAATYTLSLKPGLGVGQYSDNVNVRIYTDNELTKLLGTLTATASVTVETGDQDAPEAPQADSRTRTSIKLKTIEPNKNGAAVKYSIDGGVTWQESPEFTGLSSRTTYGFVARYEATADFNPSAPSAETKIATSGSSGTYQPPKPEVKPQPEEDPLFDDVDKDAWYSEDVKYVYDKGLMTGVADDLFDPAGTTTRGMVVTILYRLEGQPRMTVSGGFTDVAGGSWYESAVAWASANDIASGYGDGRFGPDDPITREQLAAILFRYAGLKGRDVSVGEDTNILSFNDAFDVSEYAVPAMQWACGSGLIQGSDGYLMPRGAAERAQLAAILHRFIEN